MTTKEIEDIHNGLLKYDNDIIDWRQLTAIVHSATTAMTEYELNELRRQFEILADELADLTVLESKEEERQKIAKTIIDKLRDKVVISSDKVGNVEICEPIKKALNVLKSKGGQLIERRLADQHFKEFYFEILMNESTDLEIEGIEQTGSKITCNCHWTTIEMKTRLE